MGCRRVLALLVVVAAAGCNNDDSPGPRIDQLAPPQAVIGDTINILGERFCAPVTGTTPPPIDAAVVGVDAGPPPPPAAPGDDPCAAGFVTFGPLEGLTKADAIEWTDTRIIMRVPNIGPGPTSVVVTVNGRQSAAADFEVIQQ